MDEKDKITTDQVFLYENRVYACLTPSQRTNTQATFSDHAIPSDIR